MFNKITNSPVIFMWFSITVCCLERRTWSGIFTFLRCVLVLPKFFIHQRMHKRLS